MGEKFQVELVNKELYCNNYLHNNGEILSIDTKNFQNRLLCQQCLNELYGDFQLISKPIAQEKILKKMQDLLSEQKTNYFEPLQKKIHQSIQFIENFRTQMNQTLNQINETLNLWNKDLTSFFNRKALINFDDGLKIITNIKNEISLIEEIKYFIEQGINSYNHKLMSHVAILQEENQRVQINFPIQLNYQDPKLSYKTKFEKKQQQPVKALAFNKDNSILATSQENKINIWNFKNSTMELTDIIKPHQSEITVLVFSQTYDIIIAGYYDGKINCFQKLKERWETIIDVQKTQAKCSRFFSMILNKEEDQLITCGQDTSILIWNCNFKSKQKTLELSYQLDKHERSIFCLSLNEWGSLLISSGADEIIIWEERKKSWEFKQKISIQGCYCFRICFLDSSTFAWAQENQGILHIYEFNIAQKHFEENLDRQIKLKSYSLTDDYAYFPPKYLRERNILMLKHSKYVNLIDFSENIVTQLAIDCQSSQNHGNITNDGKYLVVWNDESKSIEVFEIDYK